MEMHLTQLQSTYFYECAWIFGLAFLEPDEVEDIFFEEFMSILPPELRDFADYLVNNYMTFESTYPPTLWASSNVEDRTTNACETIAPRATGKKVA